MNWLLKIMRLLTNFTSLASMPVFIAIFYRVVIVSTLFLCSLIVNGPAPTPDQPILRIRRWIGSTESMKIFKSLDSLIPP